MRVAFQSQVESLRAGLSAATKPDRSMSGLIAKLFADRPAEKREVRQRLTLLRRGQAWLDRDHEQSANSDAHSTGMD